MNRVELPGVGSTFTASRNVVMFVFFAARECCAQGMDEVGDGTCLLKHLCLGSHELY